MNKLNILDMFSMDGKIVQDDDLCVVKETKRIGNHSLYSGVVYRDKHIGPFCYRNHDSVYLIVDGRASIETDTKIAKCHQYDIVLVQKGEKHMIINTGDVHLRYMLMKEKV